MKKRSSERFSFNRISLDTAALPWHCLVEPPLQRGLCGLADPDNATSQPFAISLMNCSSVGEAQNFSSVVVARATGWLSVEGWNGRGEADSPFAAT